MPKACRRIAAVFALLAAGALPAQAGLLGTQVSLRYDFAAQQSLDSFVVVSGAELTCTGGGAGNGNVCGFLNNAGSTQTVDVGDNSLGYALAGTAAGFASVTPNAFVFLLPASYTVAGVSLSSSISGLNAARVSFTPGSVTVNMSGLAVAGGQGFTVALTPVPEPAAWGLMLGGTAALLALRRRRAVLASPARYGAAGVRP